MIGAQAILLGEVKKEFGGVARALALTDAGKLQQLANATGDVAEKIGKKLLPAQLAAAKAGLLFAKGVDTTLNFIKGLIDQVRGLVSPFSAMDSQFAAFGTRFAGISVGIASFIALTPRLIAAFKKIGAALTGLSAGGGAKAFGQRMTVVVASALAVTGLSFAFDKEAEAATARAQSNVDSILSKVQGLNLATGGGIGGGGGGGGDNKRGFVGLQDLGRQIQENLLQQQQEQRAEEQLQETKEQSQTLDKISATMDRVDAGIARLSTGVVKSRGTA